MDQWSVPPNMINLANQTTMLFGYDTSGKVPYCFNNLGFRSPEPDNRPGIAVVGNSVSFGIGLPLEQTFGSILCNSMNRALDNKSFGCYIHENHDHIHNIDVLSKQNRDLVFLVQINNLDRRREGNIIIENNDQSWCSRRFLDYFDQVESLLCSRPRIYLYWDDKEHSIPAVVQKKIAIKNVLHLDSSLPHAPWTFGKKSNNAIAKCLYSLVNKNITL